MMCIISIIAIFCVVSFCFACLVGKIISINETCVNEEAVINSINNSKNNK